MTLAELLDTYWRHAAEREPELAAAVEREERTVRASGLLARALRVGDTAPDFALPDSPGGSLRLSDLLRDGTLVLAFYRGRWCPYCTLELRAWQRALPELHALGGRLLAVSPQDERQIALMRERDGLRFHMVSDAGNAIARSFGVAAMVDPGLRDAYTAAGLAVAPGSGPQGWTLPLPAVYLIATGRRVAWAHVDANWRRRAEPAEVLRRVAALTGR